LSGLLFCGAGFLALRESGQAGVFHFARLRFFGLSGLRLKLFLTFFRAKALLKAMRIVGAEAPTSYSDLNFFLQNWPP